MAEPKNEEFLDDIETAEAEELAEETIEIDEVEAEIDALRAEIAELQRQLDERRAPSSAAPE